MSINTTTKELSLEEVWERVRIMRPSVLQESLVSAILRCNQLENELEQVKKEKEEYIQKTKVSW